GVTRTGGGEGLFDYAAGVCGVLFQVLGETFGGGLLDHVLDLGIVQLALGLALELGVGEAHGYDGGETFAHVVAGEVGVLVLEDTGLAGVVVEGTGARAT